MNRIGDIVCDDLFHLEFISPHMQRFCLVEHNLNFSLLCQNLGRLDHSLYQRCQIKTFHIHLIITKFQLIQCQQFLHHLVHLSRFIYNHITIELTAFFIIVNIILETFCIPLNQCDRRFQLMGNIRQKFFSHFINFFFFFNVFLQFIICRLQFRNRLFQGF